MTRLLITGFGPFPGVPRNPTAALAERLARDRCWRRAGVDARALVLSTAWSAIDDALLPAIRRQRPDAVLLLGVAARRPQICLETRAVNRITRRLPDVTGRLPTHLAYRTGEPHIRRARAAVPMLATAMRAAGPFSATRLSRDAGRYLCNAAYFAALAEPGPRAVVFVHVPMPRTGSGRPLDRGAGVGMSQAQLFRVLRAAARATTVYRRAR